MGESKIQGSIYFLLFFTLLVLVSGCTTKPESIKNATNVSTEYEYENASGNFSFEIDASDVFTFKVHGNTEFWLKPNASVSFYVVFNNLDEDKQAHKYIAKVFPSAANFDVMAAYKCLHFVSCDSLISDMQSMIQQPDTPITINYTHVGLYEIRVAIPSHMPSGVYMFNIVACKDLSFKECNETTTNFGPNIPLVVNVIEW